MPMFPCRPLGKDSVAESLHDQLQHALGDSYILERELPRGGMSQLFLAREPALERSVVVKLLPPELASDVSAERFRREILLTARLQHPHILSVLNAGFKGSLLFYITPFVRGESLRAELLREARLPIPKAIRIIRELADALACAHDAGVIHRDLKPENVLLEHGHVVLADFGVARAIKYATREQHLTGTDLRIGTLGYMAPEQLAADTSIDGRADIYALGVIAFEILTGIAPFSADSPHGLIAAHLSETPASIQDLRPDVSTALATLVTHMLSKDVDKRPASAQDIVALLDEAAKSTDLPTFTGVRTRRIWVVTGFLAAIFLIGYWATTNGRRSKLASERATAASTGRVAQPAKSVAVLPFVNLSDDAKNEYFSDGMTEDLIDALGRVKGLKVAARTSSFAFKGKSEDVGVIGEKLHVSAVVEGSVRKQGRRLRVTAELVNVSDGFHLWSETYDRELRDVFQVQDDISRAIVNALRVQLDLSISDGVPARSGTNDPAALDLFLRGRFLFNQRTNESLEGARRYFERAVKQDTAFAQSYSALAATLSLIPVFNVSARPADYFPKARAAAIRALTLDSTRADAHAVIAYTNMLDYHWDIAGREFARSLELDPNDADIQEFYATYLSAIGNQHEAVAHLRRALELDPLSRIININLAFQLAIGREYDDALRQNNAALELDPNFASARSIACYVQTMRHQFALALVECKRAIELGGRENGGLGQLAYTYAAAGDSAQAVVILREMKDMARRRYVGPLEFTYAYLGLGRKDEALFWFDSAVSARDPNMTDSFNDPMLDPLRSDPRFSRSLMRMNLPGGRSGLFHN